MSNRLTKGQGLLGSLLLPDSGLRLGSDGGTAVDATAAELNQAADLSAVGALVRIKKIAISATPTGAEQDTGWDLPAKALVLDVFLDVTTAETDGTTKTLDVGTLSSGSGGDADGFLDGISVSQAGIKRGTFVQTVGSNNTYLGAASTHTLGALLTGLLIAGEDTAAGGDGFAVARPYASNSTLGKRISYTAGSNDFVSFRGSICITYIEIG